jgi:butyrate kinase
MASARKPKASRRRSSDHLILVINPGSTSTKLGVFRSEKQVLTVTVRHKVEEFAGLKTVAEQYPRRQRLIVGQLANEGYAVRDFDAVVARGGLMKPIEGGTYKINRAMLRDLEEAKRGEHASNLGALIADALARPAGIPAFVVDPVAIDEMIDIARFSGLPEIRRESLWHALNIRRVARIVAARMGKKMTQLNLVVGHLGGGITIAALRRGRCIDVNNAIEGGPFSPERAGGLPILQFMDVVLTSGLTRDEWFKRLTRHSGVVGYLGTNDMKRVEEAVKRGRKAETLIWDAMVYQIAKEIAAMATTMECKLDAVILTGGLAYSKKLVCDVRRRVGRIAKVIAYPGEDELAALAEGALRVLRGEEEARRY